MKRTGKPEEVAALVGFLCSEQAAYISGQIIGIDGAMRSAKHPPCSCCCLVMQVRNVHEISSTTVGANSFAQCG